MIILMAALLAAGLSIFAPALAQQDPGITPWERFSEYDEESKTVINHDPLTSTLANSVLPFGRSKTRLKTYAKKEYFKNSRIPKILNGSPSRLEGNRLMIHAFSDDHRAFFKGYQAGLENLSLRRPLRNLNKNEQLAYWLNLYNVIVINKLIEEYPISQLKSLRKKDQSYWDRKVATIEGVPLSLSDIEQILIHNWDSPLVIYGLFQGSIGGPTLLREAYTGATVWALLETNAREFVNSNRGVIPKKKDLVVSKFYGWVKGAFEDSDQVLLDHINAYADPAFMGDISHLTTVKYSYYDWFITDILEGRTHAGDFTNDRVVHPDPGTIEWHLVQAGLWDQLKMLPPGARDLVIEAITTNEIPYKQPVVTSVECAPGETCAPDETPDGK